MFFLTYILSELRRRSGRTLLTALGLGLGVGLVVTHDADVAARAQRVIRMQDGRLVSGDRAEENVVEAVGSS